MTPEELATIPEPVPTAAAAASAGSDSTLGSLPLLTSPDRSPEPPAGGSSVPPAPVPADGPAWRVQIFATPELSQADRMSKEAAARLGVRGTIEFEEGLYKVRLGAFATEEEAQALRERAVREGYPGAFRVRTGGDASGGE